jgi:hypothetical protein
MFKQDIDGFPLEVNKYGCYFFCLLQICELESGNALSKAQINDIYATARLHGYIGAQCSCISPDNICRLAMIQLDCRKQILQVGDVDSQGRSAFWKWAQKVPYNTPKYICMTFATGGPIGTHYVLGNMTREILFDPSSHDYTQNNKLGGLWHTVIGG